MGSLHAAARILPLLAAGGGLGRRQETLLPTAAGALSLAGRRRSR